MKNSISKIDPRINLEFLTKAKENQYFDRKSARIDAKKIANHISAFANAGGGVLVIGVEDEGKLTGFNNAGFSKIDKFRTIPFKFLKSKPIINMELINIKNDKSKKDKILVYHIEPSVKRIIGTKPGYVYLRVGDQSRRLTQSEIIRLKYDKKERHIEEELVRGSSIMDIDTKLLKWYKNKIKTDLDDKEVLESRGLLVGDKLTLAGVLIFSKNPFKYYYNSRLHFLRYKGINLIKNINIIGSIPKIIKNSRKVILNQLKDFKILNRDGNSEIILEYPEVAWLEGIVNALIHRDYSRKEEFIRVIMYDDKLEISSPGKLPNIIDISNIMNKKYSRNPIISRVLSEFASDKESNKGIKGIYYEMEKYSLEPPEYSEPNKDSVLLKLKGNYNIK